LSAAFKPPFAIIESVEHVVHFVRSSSRRR
jgi:hypothetical protein